MLSKEEENDKNSGVSDIRYLQNISQMGKLGFFLNLLAQDQTTKCIVSHICNGSQQEEKGRIALYASYIRTLLQTLYTFWRWNK